MNTDLIWMVTSKACRARWRRALCGAGQQPLGIHIDSRTLEASSVSQGQLALPDRLSECLPDGFLQIRCEVLEEIKVCAEAALLNGSAIALASIFSHFKRGMGKNQRLGSIQLIAPDLVMPLR